MLILFIDAMSMSAILVIIILLIGTIIVVANFPAIKTFFSSVENESSSSQTIIITKNPSEIPRWNHFPITVYIQNYNTEYTDDVIAAMNAWESVTNNLIQFSIVSNPDADIMVRWAKDVSDDFSATGDTELSYISTGLYDIIEGADIKLREELNGMNFKDIDETNIALHEFGHALGLEHSNVTGDIMYPVLTMPSRKIIQPSQAYSQLFNEIYSIQPKSDLSFYGSVTASESLSRQMAITRYYIDASFIVKNIGMVNSTATTVSIYADNNLVNDQSLPILQPAESMSFSIRNIYSPTHFNYVRIAIDRNNLVDELNKTDDVVIINMSQQP
jgi:predicted Zn-dependent protease